MGELPDTPLVIIEDLVLPVVLHHVFEDEGVVDHRRSHRLLVPLNLLLHLELILNMRLHGLGANHFLLNFFLKLN